MNNQRILARDKSSFSVGDSAISEFDNTDHFSSVLSKSQPFQETWEAHYLSNQLVLWETFSEHDQRLRCASPSLSRVVNLSVTAFHKAAQSLTLSKS